MAILLYFDGKLNELGDLALLESTLIEVGVELGGIARLIRTRIDSAGLEEARGVSIDFHNEFGTHLSFLFDSQGMMIESPENIQRIQKIGQSSRHPIIADFAWSNRGLASSTRSGAWNSINSTGIHFLAPVDDLESFKQATELLAIVRERFCSDLVVVDPTGYWESLDEEALSEFASIVRQHRSSMGQPPESNLVIDIESLAPPTPEELTLESQFRHDPATQAHVNQMIESKLREGLGFDEALRATFEQLGLPQPIDIEAGEMELEEPRPSSSRDMKNEPAPMVRGPDDSQVDELDPARPMDDVVYVSQFMLDQATGWHAELVALSEVPVRSSLGQRESLVQSCLQYSQSFLDGISASVAFDRKVADDQPSAIVAESLKHALRNGAHLTGQLQELAGTGWMDQDEGLCSSDLARRLDDLLTRIGRIFRSRTS